ncbi:MAG: hypothetical protein CL608_13750 [Anaerolineaceae bacterium]|nr:hypothetical protein [Anaerolineaceae bacterium]
MTTKTDNTIQRSQAISFWPLRWKTVFLFLGLLLLLWLGVKGWRIGQAINSLLTQQETAQTLMANGLTNIDPDAAESMVSTIRQDFIVLRHETAFLMPFMPRLGWVPKVGPLLVSTPQLVEMGDAGTETAVYAMASLKPILHIIQVEDADDGQLPQLINALAEARPGLAQAALSLDRVVQARADITNVDAFPERLKPLFAQADEWLPIAQDSLAIVQILPEIMGQDGRRTYLLLAQNEDEIRATGGFISGVGTLTVENGDIQSLAFQDASTFDTQTLLENSDLYDYPPQPLYEFMGLDYLLLRDANYWPDFPHSAQTAIELYQRVEPETMLDGVIAIDQQFMSLLVAATGPVKIADGGETITAQNTVESFRNAFNIREDQTVQDWLQNRKAFLLTFATAILDKIQSNFGAVEPIAFIKNMHEALNNRHLQIYLVDAEETAVLDQLNWDGRLENPPGQDFLLVLDTNMGYNKTNMHIQRSYVYNVTLNPVGESESDLTISYKHTNLPIENSVCEQGISYANAPNYQEIADRCYFNFLRIYAPLNSHLSNASTHQVPAETLLSGIAWNGSPSTTNEFAKFTTFTNFFMVPRGEELTTAYNYTLPQTIVQRGENGQFVYNLWLQKQAGSPTESVRVNVTLPEGSTLLNYQTTSEAAMHSETNVVEISLDLQTDTQISITFSQ